MIEKLKWVTDDHRPHINTVFHQAGYDYITNGSFLLREKGNAGADLGKSAPVMSYFNWNLIEEAKKYQAIKLSDIDFSSIEKCLACNGDESEADCPECSGYGLTDCHCCGQEIVCPECDGDGVINCKILECYTCNGTGLNNENSIEIFNKPFSPVYLELFKRLECEIVFYDFEIITDSICFTFGNDGIGIIMNRRV